MGIKRPACNAAAIINHGNLVGVAIIFEAGLDASGNLALPGSVKRRAQAAAIIDRRIAAQAILAQLLAGLQLSIGLPPLSDTDISQTTTGAKFRPPPPERASGAENILLYVA